MLQRLVLRSIGARSDGGMEAARVGRLLSRVRLDLSASYSTQSSSTHRAFPLLFLDPYSLNGARHRCGAINVGGDKFDDRLRENDRRLGAPIEDLSDAKAVRTKLLSSLRHSTNSSTTPMHSNARCVGSLTNYRGYFNPEGGWAEAARAVGILLSRVREMGGRVIENQEVVELVKDENGRTTGVRCRDGKRFEGDRVILTIGSWTASTFPELELDSKCLATG